MSISWTELDYKIKEWVEYRHIGDLLALQCDVEDAIKKVIDKNRTQFEKQDNNKLLQSLGLNDITKGVTFKHDFHYMFEFEMEKEYITAFKSIVEHWLNGDIIVSVYTEEAEVNVLYFHNIKKFYITNNDILIRDEYDNDISFDNNNFFVIHDNTLIPLHIRFREENSFNEDMRGNIGYIDHQSTEMIMEYYHNIKQRYNIDVTFGQYLTQLLFNDDIEIQITSDGGYDSGWEDYFTDLTFRR